MPSGWLKLFLPPYREFGRLGTIVLWTSAAQTTTVWLVNRGAQVLKQQLAERGNQRALSEELGIDAGHVSRIVHGKKIPGLAARRKLFRSRGIAMHLWDEPATEEGTTDAAQ